MRIAVVSDVHGNLTALEAVVADLSKEKPDLIVNGGDLVGSGARPADVVDLVTSLGWPGVFGNTDEVQWNDAPLRDLALRLPAMKKTFDAVADDVAWTREQLGDARIASLRTMPLTWTGHGVSVVHASPDSAWSSPQASASDTEFADAYAGLGTPLVVYGHLHLPFVRGLPRITVANSGSAGLSHDGDARASYLLIQEGRPQIRRIEYDVDAEITELAARRHPNADWIASIIRAARYAPPG